MHGQKWIPIYGNAHIEGATITHLPVLFPAPATMPAADGAPPPAPHVVVRSNLEFEQGTITWEAKIADQNCRAQLMLPAEAGAARAAPSEKAKADSADTELAVGLNVLGTPYGFGIWNGSWEAAGGAGLGSLLPLDTWIPLKLTVRGSVVELYVHGVKILSTTRMLKRGQIAVLLQGNSQCSIRNVSVIEDAPMCFVVMQFTDEFNVLYQDVIRPICESYGYKVVRGDDFYTSGQILEDVTESIRSAALIIADVTPHNENVFYELGFAHAIGKPTILLSDRKRDRLPFDIAGFRTIFYDNTIGGKAVVEARLKQHLDALGGSWSRPPNKALNPTGADAPAG